ncbi:MAG: hypothetical protein ACYCDJ_01025, partial [Gardnerella vaginalis]
MPHAYEEAGVSVEAGYEVVRRIKSHVNRTKRPGVVGIEECGAEVQKGNAPIERKLQRLFRRKDACRLIKRCNDFGAGGVSVATGEIADG